MRILKVINVIAISFLLVGCKTKYEIYEPDNRELVIEIAERINQNITEDMTSEEFAILIMKSAYPAHVLIDSYDSIDQISELPDYLKNIYGYELNGEYILNYDEILTQHANEHNITILHEETYIDKGHHSMLFEPSDEMEVNYSSFGIRTIVPSSVDSSMHVFDFGSIEQGNNAKLTYVGLYDLYWHESFSRYAFYVFNSFSTDSKFFYFKMYFPDILKNIDFSSMID